MRKLSCLVVILVATAAIGTSSSSATAPPSNCVTAQPALAPTGPHETVTVAQPARDGQPGIALVRYPRPNAPGDVWSQWGQGLVFKNGRFVSAIGNELGADGNSYLF